MSIYLDDSQEDLDTCKANLKVISEILLEIQLLSQRLVFLNCKILGINKVETSGVQSTSIFSQNLIEKILIFLNEVLHI